MSSVNKRSPHMRDNKREGGAALIISMLLLVMMSILGVAALDTVSLDQQVAGFQSRQKTSFYAAEAAVAEAVDALENSGTPAVSNTTLSDAAVYPHGQPSYGLDPDVADPIESLGLGSIEGMNLQIGQGGSAKYQMEFWRVHVQGQEAGGGRSKLEVKDLEFKQASAGERKSLLVGEDVESIAGRVPPLRHLEDPRPFGLRHLLRRADDHLVDEFC